MGFSKLYHKINSLIHRNSKPIMLLIVSHNSVWVACIFNVILTIVLCMCIQGETLIKYYLSIYFCTPSVEKKVIINIVFFLKLAFSVKIFS